MELGAQLVTVGREILTGRILDTNSRYVAQKLNFLGIPLMRIAVVDDNVDDIAQELTQAFSRPMSIIITLGGLGPTFDDITLEGVAKACNRQLVLNQQAREMVKSKYSWFLNQGAVDHDRLTPEREKMAWLPEGATPLPNSVGAAPGVSLVHQGKTVFSLPGVPAEMEAIFEQSVQPQLAGLVGRRVFLEESLLSGCKDESVLAPLIKEVMAQLAGIYIKSCANLYTPEENLRIVVTAVGDDKRETQVRLQTTLEILRNALKIS